MLSIPPSVEGVVIPSGVGNEPASSTEERLSRGKDRFYGSSPDQMLKRVNFVIRNIIGSLLLIVLFIQLQTHPSHAVSSRGKKIPQTKATPSKKTGVTRTYYIAAEQVDWNFAPTGMDLTHNDPIAEPWRGNTQWSKIRYIEYTDNTYRIRKPQPEWLGILGPIIRAEVGDTIKARFLNRTGMIFNIHVHGLRYDKNNEGSAYEPQGAGGRILPGESYTYTWQAKDESGPGPDEGSSKVWLYHSHVDEAADPNFGLIGPIIVTARGKARPDGFPKDVAREFVTLFMIFKQVGADDAGEMFSINGLIFGNLRGLVMKKGEKVRWHLLALGGEEDVHTPHWHGSIVRYHRRKTDVIELLPGSMITADMIADNPGTWLFHCHVFEHMMGGMMTTYTILP